MSPAPSGLLRLKVVIPRHPAVEAEVVEVRFPSLEGERGILAGHRPLVAALGRGTLFFRSSTGEQSLEVRGGFADVRPDAVFIFTELAGEGGSDGGRN